jgi:hypothetical protein
MMLMGKIVLGFAGAAVAGVGVLCSEGMVEVNVVERQPQQHHVFVIAPALLVPIALHFVPKEKLGEASRELRPWLPTVRAAMHELRRTDDVTLVEVKESDQHVVVKKEGGSIVVDVEDGNDTVHVSTPIRAIESSFEEIAAGAPAQTQ